MSKRLLVVGLDEPEVEALRPLLDDLLVTAHPVLPRYQIERGVLWAESQNGGRFFAVDRVIFHGIFEDDFDFITALALWGGACLPSAQGLLDCRLRLPCLAKALSITRFGAMRRSFLAGGSSLSLDGDNVAKWGNWHCGENKARFSGRFEAQETSVLEPFIEGDAVRVVIIGDQHWQIKLEGDSWLKSIHHETAHFMPVDEELLADTRALSRGLRLEMLGVDYMVGRDGERHLLEVNHIPNVTRFPELREAFLSLGARWATGVLKGLA